MRTICGDFSLYTAMYELCVLGKDLLTEFVVKIYRYFMTNPEG